MTPAQQSHFKDALQSFMMLVLAAPNWTTLTSDQPSTNAQEIRLPTLGTIGMQAFVTNQLHGMNQDDHSCLGHMNLQKTQ